MSDVIPFISRAEREEDRLDAQGVDDWDDWDSTELATELVVKYLIATEAIGPGGIDPSKVLQAIHWPLAGTDEPQRMTAEEADAVIEFGAAIIAAREIWPTDSVGAGLKLAAWEHDWRPVPEPDQYGQDNEENAVQDAVSEAMYRRFVANPPRTVSE